MQKYMNFTKENLHVTINVTQKRLGVNENYARKNIRCFPTEVIGFRRKAEEVNSIWRFRLWELLQEEKTVIQKFY